MPKRSSRPGAQVPFEARYAERAIYTCDGEIEVAGERFGRAAAAGAARPGTSRPSVR